MTAASLDPDRAPSSPWAGACASWGEFMTGKQWLIRAMASFLLQLWHQENVFKVLGRGQFANVFRGGMQWMRRSGRLRAR